MLLHDPALDFADSQRVEPASQQRIAHDATSRTQMQLANTPCVEKSRELALVGTGLGTLTDPRFFLRGLCVGWLWGGSPTA